MGAKMTSKMEPNGLLGRSWDRLGRFWRGLRGDRFSMNFRSAKSPPKIAKEATNGGQEAPMAQLLGGVGGRGGGQGRGIEEGIDIQNLIFAKLL